MFYKSKYWPSPAGVDGARPQLCRWTVPGHPVPRSPLPPILVGVGAVVEALVGVGQAGLVVQRQHTALALLQLLGEPDGHLLPGLILQQGHLPGLALAQLRRGGTEGEGHTHIRTRTPACNTATVTTIVKEQR